MMVKWWWPIVADVDFCDLWRWWRLTITGWCRLIRTDMDWKLTDDNWRWCPIMHDNIIYWCVAEKMAWKVSCEERCWTMMKCERTMKIVQKNADAWSKDDVWWKMIDSLKKRVTIMDAWCRLILDDEQGWSMMLGGHDILADGWWCMFNTWFMHGRWIEG